MSPPARGARAPRRSRERVEIAISPGLDLMRGLLHVSHGIERLSLRMEATLGVTAQQRLVLRVVGHHPGITPGRLAEHLHLDPGTISAVVRRLEAKGLVRRRPDPRDRRRITLGLTKSGRSLHRSQPGTVEGVLDQVVQTEDPSVRSQVQAFLMRLAKKLESAADHPATLESGRDRR